METAAYYSYPHYRTHHEKEGTRMVLPLKLDSTNWDDWVFVLKQKLQDYEILCVLDATLEQYVEAESRRLRTAHEATTMFGPQAGRGGAESFPGQQDVGTYRRGESFPGQDVGGTYRRGAESSSGRQDGGGTSNPESTRGDAGAQAKGAKEQRKTLFRTPVGGQQNDDDVRALLEPDRLEAFLMDLESYMTGGDDDFGPHGGQRDKIVIHCTRQYKAMDRDARNLITNSVGKEVMYLLRNPAQSGVPSAYLYYHCLRSHFCDDTVAKRISYFREMCSSKFKLGDDFAKFISKMFTLAGRLKNTKMAGVVGEETLLSLLLEAFPQEFSTSKMVIMQAMNDNLDLSRAISMLRERNEELEKQATPTMVSKAAQPVGLQEALQQLTLAVTGVQDQNHGGRPTCPVCGRTHTEAECWKAHPELMPEWARRERAAEEQRERAVVASVLRAGGMSHSVLRQAGLGNIVF